MPTQDNLKLTGGGNKKQGLVPTHWTLWRGPGINNAGPKREEYPPCVDRINEFLKKLKISNTFRPNAYDYHYHLYYNQGFTAQVKAVGYLFMYVPPQLRIGDPVSNFHNRDYRYLVSEKPFKGHSAELVDQIPQPSAGPGSSSTRSNNYENYYRLPYSIYDPTSTDYFYIVVYNKNETYVISGRDSKVQNNYPTSIEFLNKDGKKGIIIPADTTYNKLLSDFNKGKFGRHFLSIYSVCN